MRVQRTRRWPADKLAAWRLQVAALRRDVLTALDPHGDISHITWTVESFRHRLVYLYGNNY
jgi:hypothetical protein